MSAIGLTMITEPLFGILLMNIHRYIPIAADATIESFARSQPRRTELINLTGKSHVDKKLCACVFFFFLGLSYILQIQPILGLTQEGLV